jgi:hypothetical protein
LVVVFVVAFEEAAGVEAGAGAGVVCEAGAGAGIDAGAGVDAVFPADPLALLASGAASHVLIPLWPRHAPDLFAAVVYVPSLH